MKKIIVFFCWALIVPTATTSAQKSMDDWKRVICNEEKFSGNDSLIFCHVFDSLNLRYGVVKIFLSKKGSVNHYIPLLIGRKGVLILSEKSWGYHKASELWIKELAHAFQFSREPIKYNALSIKESTRALYRTLFQNKKFRRVSYIRMTFADMYKLTYVDTKTFEYEAHRVIEVQLNTYLKYRLRQGLPQK